MDPEKQISRVPFTDLDTESLYVKGSEETYLVQRINGVIDGICPGDHVNLLEWESSDDINAMMEPCKAFTVRI